MRRIVLAGIKHRDAYNRAIEAPVLQYLEETIFAPLFDLLEQAKVETRENAEASSALVLALRAGRIWYADGTFSGLFNSAISSELRNLGATFNRNAGTFHLAPAALPMEVCGVAAQSLEASIALHQAIDKTLGIIQMNAAQAITGIDVKAVCAAITKDLDLQFRKSLKPVPIDVEVIAGLDTVEVEADITPAIAKTMADELTNRLDLEIKNFVAADIPKLRAEVQANMYAGYRTDRLADIIEARYGVSKRKAAFLADQETGLAVAKFREARAKEVGSRSYTWSTSHDERVRADHRLLDDRVFAWDSPPITNRATGDRNHPGEDFRCRCVALPILEIPE